MADMSVKLEKKSKDQDPAYHAVLEDFKNHCENTIQHYEQDQLNPPNNNNAYTTLGQKYSLTTSTPVQELPNELTLLSAELAFWIYVPTDPIPQPVSSSLNKADQTQWHYKKIVQSKKTQIAQWAFLQHSLNPKEAYLVFKGTDPNMIFDMIADTGVIPMPIWCKEDQTATTNKMNRRQSKRLSSDLSNNIDLNALAQELKDNDNDVDDIDDIDDDIDDIDDNDWQFCAHSGMYASLMRDFHRIWKVINSRICYFDNIYIIGHSLGGGLAKLFALESIINKFLPSNKIMKVITFGSPVVISYENNYNSLSRHAKKILFQLHNMCHCFVNRFDPVVRVPTRCEWMMTVIPYALRKIIADQMSSKMKLPSFLKPLVKSGVKTGVSKFVQYVEKYQDLLQSYHPFGTYYFYINDAKSPFITKNQMVIEEILGFIPPHKITTSKGNEVRVCHYSVKIDQIQHHQRFSLATVTDITLNNNNDDGIKDNNSSSKKDKNKKKNSKMDDQKDIIDLLTLPHDDIDDDGEGFMYDSNAIYIAIETDNDAVKQIYLDKKLSDKGWLMLVSNHLMEQYIDIFKVKIQLNKPKYPILISPKSNHFGASDDNKNDKNDNNDNIEKKDNNYDENIEAAKAAMVATGSLLKSVGKKWWNKAQIKAKEQLKDIAKPQTTQVIQPPQPQQPAQPVYYSQQQPQQPVYYAQQQPQHPVYYVQPPRQLSGTNANVQSNPIQYQQQQYYTHYPQYQQQQYNNQNVAYMTTPNNNNNYAQQQQIGNTQYSMAQSANNAHYIVYKQQQQQVNNVNNVKKHSYPTLNKK